MLGRWILALIGLLGFELPGCAAGGYLFGVPADAPVAWAVYAGAGRLVPGDFFGIHFRTWPLSNSFTATLDPTTDRLDVTHSNRGNDSWRQIYLTTTGSLSGTGLAIGVQYWCLPVDATHVQLATSKDGPAIDIIGAGTGTITAEFRTPDPDFGYGHVRSLGPPSLLWENINTADGVYAWTNLDAIISRYVADGKTFTYTLVGTPTWASSNPTGGSQFGAAGDRAPPINIASDTGPLKTFITALITHYNKAAGGFYGTDATRIGIIECWNEPAFAGSDSGYFSGTATQMAQMSKACYQAVKAVDPAVQVHSPSFSSGSVGPPATGEASLTTGRVALWLAASDGAGGTGKDWMDALAFHPYDRGTFISATDLGAVNDWITSVLSTAGVASSATFPRYAAEWGYDTTFATFNALTPVQRANNFRRSAVIAAALGWKQIDWYAWDLFLGQVRYLGDVVLVADVSSAFNDSNFLAGKTLTEVDLLQDGRVRFRANGTRYYW